MIKTILVPATGSDIDTGAFASALSIARAFGAHIDVLHTRLDAVDIAVRMTADAAGTPLIGDLIERLEQDAAEREAKAKHLFENFCSGEGLAVLDGPTVQTGAAPTAQWHVETGDEARSITAYGMTADLIVAARGGKNDATERSILEAALLDTGRPLLIPGEGPAPAFIGETIAIAWKATP